jgi:hypothetical protein
MNKKILGGLGIIAAFVLILVIALNARPVAYTGGSFNPVKVDFAQGISVNGTEVINNLGRFTGVVTGSFSGTTGAFSGAVTALKSVLAPAADTTLTAAQSGSIIKMNTAGQDMTLPTASASTGAHYRFVVTAAVATTNMTIVAAPADTIEGTLIVAGAVVDCDAADIITFVIDGENIGDFVDLYTDGTSWLIGESGTLTASKMTCSG